MANDGASQAEVFITKVAAAQRQLDAAIRMTFVGEDELAIHTVVAAAYRIIRDLRAKRGKHELPHEVFLEGLFGAAKAVADGDTARLPRELRELTASDATIARLAAFISATRRELGRDVDLSDVKVTLSEERNYWRDIQEAANFLKHADVDHSKALARTRLKTDDLLDQGISS